MILCQCNPQPKICQGCLVLFVSVIVFEFVVFHNRPQIEVLEAFLLVAGFDLLFSICFGSIVACCFQSRLQRRQTYLRWAQINRGTAPSTESSTMPPTGAPLHLYRNLEYYHYQHHHHRPQRNHSTMVAYV